MHQAQVAKRARQAAERQAVAAEAEVDEAREANRIAKQQLDDVQAERRRVPARPNRRQPRCRTSQVLHRTGQRAFVINLPDDVWAPCTLRTLTYTDGSIDYAIEVADRRETVPIPGTSTKILLLLQGQGEPWDQHRVAHVALNDLRTLSITRSDENFLALQTKLIERGYDEAIDLTHTKTNRDQSAASILPLDQPPRAFISTVHYALH